MSRRDLICPPVILVVSLSLFLSFLKLFLMFNALVNGDEIDMKRNIDYGYFMISPCKHPLFEFVMLLIFTLLTVFNFSLIWKIFIRKGRDNIDKTLTVHIIVLWVRSCLLLIYVLITVYLNNEKNEVGCNEELFEFWKTGTVRYQRSNLVIFCDIVCCFILGLFYTVIPETFQQWNRDQRTSPELIFNLKTLAAARRAEEGEEIPNFVLPPEY